MKDLFGNTKPVQIEQDEWWFNGRIIIKQNDFRLAEWISFADMKNDSFIEKHTSKKDAINFTLANPCRTPDFFPQDYLG
ncbi:MAG: hypothetical protein JSS64_03585 [Bacteroidetes bacterium]|nr:hypothetical protein [Bacteroidota bacterium]